MKSYAQLMEELRIDIEQDEVNEATVHLVPHGGKGTHFKVVKGIKGQLDAGEVIHDSHVDDLHDIGIKTKVLKEEELTVEELEIFDSEDIVEGEEDGNEDLNERASTQAEIDHEHSAEDEKKIAMGLMHGDYKGHQTEMCKKHGMDHPSKTANRFNRKRMTGRAMNEEDGIRDQLGEESITELSQKMVRAYRDKAGEDKENMEDDRDFYSAHGDNTHHEKNEIRKRKAGIKNAGNKLRGNAKVNVKEDESEEQIEELSHGKLDAYAEKSIKSLSKHVADGNAAHVKGYEAGDDKSTADAHHADGAAHDRKKMNRLKGLGMSTSKRTNNAGSVPTKVKATGKPVN